MTLAATMAGQYAQEVKLFGKWSFEDVEINDIRRAPERVCVGLQRLRAGVSRHMMLLLIPVAKL